MHSVEGVNTAPAARPGSMPVAVYLLGLTIFAVTTSEFMVAGMMTPLAEAFGVSVARIGYLISYYALGMAIGGPLITALLLGLGLPNKQALLWLLALYVAGGALAALAPGYEVMVLARIIKGVAASACFGVSLTICAALVAPEARGRAASLVLAGLMISPVFGVPATALIAQLWGWRASFWVVTILALICMVVVAAKIPDIRSDTRYSLRDDLASLRNGNLWAAYATSGLIIGATFAAFSYVSPVFTQMAGLVPTAIPLLLAAYGVANVVGNVVVGRFADRHTIRVLVVGLILLSASLVTLALLTSNTLVAVAAFMMVGLTGVPLNPAMVARVMRAAHPGPLVNSLHTSIITGGLAFGAWTGGAAIDAGYGLTAPLWVGAGLAILGLASLAPRRFRQA